MTSEHDDSHWKISESMVHDLRQQAHAIALLAQTALAQEVDLMSGNGTVSHSLRETLRLLALAANQNTELILRLGPQFEAASQAPR